MRAKQEQDLYYVLFYESVNSILSDTCRCSHCQQWTMETTLKMPDIKAVAWPRQGSGRRLEHISICIPIMAPKVTMKVFLHVVTPTRQGLNYT